MAFSINDIKAQLSRGGARQSLFQVNINNPVSADANSKTPFMVQASQIPASTLGTIQIPYFGRILKLAGDRTYDPWTVTVINDEDFVIRNAMEQWANEINGLSTNVRTRSNYKTNAQVLQYGKTGEVIRQYTFHGIYPAEISPIELDWGSFDTYEQFTVTFNYDYWTADGRGKTGNPGE